MIGVVHWGGNIGSLLNALKRTGAPFSLTTKPSEIEKMKRLILPGVGNFGAVMESLKKQHLIEILLNRIREGVPYLGICVGMQILLEDSEESPGIKGLSLVKGRCRRFIAKKVPQVGFNSVRSKSSLIENGGFYYFINSYYCDVKEEVSVATANYEGDFCAALEKANIFGVQFHPEKSGETGLKFLRKWCDAL
ncbi:MAG: imidazole glycerol phosphate synthase subunit HisH [Planctomycetota bacterium]|nr:imidazole glycerol phosphate synthase subunit HisH [Planctomycetota bacterium]